MARIPLVTEFEGKGVDRAIKEFKRLETTGQKAGFALKKAFVPATAALAGLTAAAGLSVKAAVEDTAQQAELARTLKTTTEATEAQVAAVESYIAETEKAAAVSDTELRPAFANLVRATGDVTEAQDLMTLALDVAAGTGKDLETVTEALQEAFQGEVGPLKELDKSLTDMIASGADADEVMSQLADTFGGAAQESTETLEGRFKLMKIELDNAKEAIGMALLPVLEQLVPVLERVARFVGENTDLIVTIGVVVGTFAAAIVALNIALSVYNTIQAVTAALNAALATSFTAVWVATGVGIIIAIIAVLVTLQMKFGILGKAVDAVKWAFQQAWGALKDLINGAIDGINDLIWLINKIPGVDIPQIGRLGDDIEKYGVEPMGRFETSVSKVAERAELAREPMGRFEQSIRNVGNEGDQLATTLGRVNVELDPLNEGIETATTRLDRFFDALDQQKAADEFIEDLRDIEKRLKGIQEGTAEWQEAQNEAYEALRDLRRERKDLSDAFFEVLKLEIDTGDLERAYTLMANLVDLGGVINVPATFADLNFPELGLTPGSMFGGQNFGGGFSNQVVNNYFPEGIDIDEVIRRLQGEQRQNGAIPVNFDQNVMW
jgi:hypothetical protein